MVKGRIFTGAKLRVVCPECKQWYDKNTMVVIDYDLPTEKFVCIDCYEEKYFIPPEPLKKGDEQCLKLSVHP